MSSPTIAPGRLSRIRLRLRFELRKRLGPVASRLGRVARLPLLRGFAKLVAARREVREGLAHLAEAGDRPGRDALSPSDLPSASGGTADRTLARIDQDGFAFAVDPRDAAVFPGRDREVPRTRYRLEVVLRDGAVCVRKQFVGQSPRTGLGNWWWNLLGLPFYTEAAALLRLRGCPGVPRVRAIDPATRSIYLDYVRGANLRHHITPGGEGLHDLDVGPAAGPARLTADQRVERERALFAAGVGPRHTPAIRDLVRAMNERGVAVLDAKPGNVLVGEPSQSLYWVDFERAHLRSFPGWDRALSEQFALLNRFFGAGYVDSGAVRAFSSRPDLYSPVDFGPLGYAGNVSDVEVGEGRWWWLLRGCTSWRGKRVLDLGANNCVYAVRALQDGAAAFHCVERDLPTCEQARFVKEAFEQLECRPLNMVVHHADIVGFLTSHRFEKDAFDITMALCSLYYLSAEDIARSLRIIAGFSKECWLQGNVWTGRESEEVRRHARPEFLAEQLRLAGFTDVSVIAPKGYRRPLVIGRKPR